MATLSFSRKRKPAGLTTSYELKDHMVATNSQNITLNPHPQYVLKSELIGGGGGGSSSSDIVIHMADPLAHANYYVQLSDVTDSYTSYDVSTDLDKVASKKAVYDVYQAYLGHNHNDLYAPLVHSHTEYLQASAIVDDLVTTGTNKIVSATQIAGFYAAYLNHNHNDLYISLNALTSDYKGEIANAANMITTTAGILAFYQEYAGHNHDGRYADKVHSHDDILTNDSLLIHDASASAHPGLFVHRDHVVTASNIPATADSEHVVAYSYFRSLYDTVYSCFGYSYVTVKTITSDAEFVEGKTYYTYDDTTDTFSEATVTAGTAIVGTYYEDAESITGPSAVNPLRSIFAPIVHTHTYQDVGAAPAVHTHNDLYSPLGHDHDDVYSMIHSHPYLGDSVLEYVGIYPEMAIRDKVGTSNPNYDPEDPMSEETIYEIRDLDTETEQGIYYLNHVPAHVPYRHIYLKPAVPNEYFGMTFVYTDNSGDEQSVVLSAGNAANYLGMYGMTPCGKGQLTVQSVKLKTSSEIDAEAIVNIPYRYYQTYIDDASGAVLQRIGNNVFTDEYVLTSAETFEEGVVYYTEGSTPGTYEEADVSALIGEAIPSDTYYEFNGTNQSVVWGDWKEIGKEDIFASVLANRTYLTNKVACKCCFSKTSGPNYIDFQLPEYVVDNLAVGNTSIDALLICNTDQSTYGYGNGDVVINPIVSNKSDTESSFLSHVQVGVTTSNGYKVIRLYLPLTWYVKVADADAESNVTLTSSNIYKYYRREFTYDDNGDTVSVVISADNAALLVGMTGDIAASEYGSKSVPVATQAECAEWNIQLRMKY